MFCKIIVKLFSFRAILCKLATEMFLKKKAIAIYDIASYSSGSNDNIILKGLE